MRYRILITGFAIILFSSVLNAQVKLPALLSNNMVMQRNSGVKIWGWASPGEVVKVSGDWFDSLIKTTTDNNGKWELTLQTGDAGGPHFLVLEGTNKIKLENILFGEVWVCSGQSNMELCEKKLKTLKVRI